MTLGVLKVGALTLNENYTIADATNAQSGVRTVNISGIEHYPGRTLEQVRALADDLTSMYGKTVPVVFQHKTDRSGYYTIDDVNTTAVHWDGEATGFNWSLGLTRLGPDNAVDIESRMTYAVRNNVAGGERWHAPPIGHHTYYVGAVTPATTIRTGADGPIKVYRSIPAVNPRYGCPVASFAAGRVRFLSGGIERTGERIGVPSNGWELNNGLVRVKPSPGTSSFTTLLVAFYDGFVWREKAWDVRIAGDSLRPDVDFLGVTILRNDPEMVSLRILGKSPSTGNRVLIDLVLRRGSRFVEGYIQRTTSGEIVVCLDVAEVWTDFGLYATAAGEDTDGVRSAVGSSKPYSMAPNGGLLLSSATTMDFWIGAEIAGVDLVSPATFESGVGNWAATGGTFTQASDQFKQGSFSGKLVVTGTPALAYVRNYTNVALVVPGTRYRVSFWARSLDGADVSAAVDWQNGSATYISTDASTTTILGGVWKFLEYETPPAPAGAAQAVYGPTLNSNPPTGETLWVDQIRLRTLTDPGDKAAVLQNQYIMAASEATMAVKR